jgi:hypothetical protein
MVETQGKAIYNGATVPPGPLADSAVGLDRIDDYQTCSGTLVTNTTGLKDGGRAGRGIGA